MFSLLIDVFWAVFGWCAEIINSCVTTVTTDKVLKFIGYGKDEDQVSVPLTWSCVPQDATKDSQIEKVVVNFNLQPTQFVLPTITVNETPGPSSQKQKVVVSYQPTQADFHIGKITVKK